MSAPSVYEQYMLELINKARMDPNAEAQRLGIGLNDDLSPGTIDGSAKQPLAFMAVLNNSAAKHSISMLADNYFSHTGSDGSSVSDRILAANWAAEPGSGWVMGENISQRASSGNTFGYNSLTIDSHHNGLFKSSGHRTNLMNDRFSEIGIGQEVGSYTASNGFTYQHTSMLTQNFADGGRAYITGVVIDDKDKDKFYDID
ncbi:MAG: CAP domain-containing protein, partial [Cohaesibacter sp.]|nr:CAP domain-containing protein [Cohaesibacter sp.]